ncbi:20074_t:CDS:2, partial [Cetraspora pellucida]
VEMLQAYNFVIKYRSEKTNMIADTLSKKPEVNSISEVHIDEELYERIKEKYEEDAHFQKILKALEDPNKENSRLCLTKKSKTRMLLLKEQHDISRHFGFEKTYEGLRRYYYWKNIAKDTKKYICSCDSCQCNKGSTQAPAGLLQLLEIPAQLWEVISIDFCKGLNVDSTYRGTTTHVTHDLHNEQIGIDEHKAYDCTAEGHVMAQLSQSRIRNSSNGP